MAPSLPLTWTAEIYATPIHHYQLYDAGYCLALTPMLRMLRMD
ncbi:hypothetical protein XHC_0589 [Xanthomonas hortorum pv. carotae str. M081]|nr:hypothetical protein XHC_0589 [Xanthomonas hortorum pv. carotae str. M081]